MTRCSCSSHGSFLIAKGLAEAAERELEVDGPLHVALDGHARRYYLDKVGSVSGLGRDGIHWPCDEIMDQQYWRFLDGA